MSENLVLLYGGGYHAKVVENILTKMNKINNEKYFVGVIVDDVVQESPFKSIELIRSSQLNQYLSKNSLKYFIVSIAMQPYGNKRMKIFNQLKSLGLQPLTIRHPTSYIDDDFNPKISEGVQLLSKSFVGTNSYIGNNCVLNTNASVDHDCILEDGVILAPSAVLCGRVHVKCNAWVAANATIIPGVTIGKESIIGAGALVRHDVPDGETVIGVPAYPKVKRQVY